MRMSAATAAPSDDPSTDRDGLVKQVAVGDAVDPLTERVERLIQTCHLLERRRKEHQETADQLTEENARLRRVLSHTQQQILLLVEQIRQMEE